MRVGWRNEGLEMYLSEGEGVTWMKSTVEIGFKEARGKRHWLLFSCSHPLRGPVEARSQGRKDQYCSMKFFFLITN